MSDTWATGLTPKQVAQARDRRCPDCGSASGGWHCCRIIDGQVVDMVHQARWVTASGGAA